MTALALTLRLALVFVLAAAVVGKLHSRASRTEYREMFTAMGVPAVLRAPVAVALVAAEIVTALMLLVPLTAVLGAAAAAALFGVLAVGVYRIVRSSQRVKCNCFGGASGAELSTVHVIRNVFLVVLAVTALGLSLAGGTVTTAVVVIAAVCAVVIAAIVVRFEDLMYLAGWEPGRR